MQKYSFKKIFKNKWVKGILIGVGVFSLFGGTWLISRNVALSKVFSASSQNVANRRCSIWGLSARVVGNLVRMIWENREFICYNKKDDTLDLSDSDMAFKPVIYLYPKTQQLVKVELDYEGELFADYPDYDSKIGGWEVIASPDGNLVKLADNQEYSYLFWEGKAKEEIDRDLSKGFVVKGEDTKVFLQEKLSEMGLIPREYNEFIVYRFPQMQDNAYNLIHFAGKQYTATAPLTITPTPDSILRVFMVWKALEEPITIEKQVLESFDRTGFSVLERGGTKVQ